MSFIGITFLLFMLKLSDGKGLQRIISFKLNFTLLSRVKISVQRYKILFFVSKFVLNAMLTQTNDNTDWVASSIWTTPRRSSYVTYSVLFALHAEYFSLEELLHRLSTWSIFCIMM